MTCLAATGQPFNDGCSGTVNLGTAPVCQQTIFSNVAATASDLGSDNTPACFQEVPSRDVWFSFIAGSENTNYTIRIEGAEENGNSIQNIQAGLYRGFCPDNVFAIATCAVAEIGSDMLQFQVSDLTPNDLYYIRIDNFGGESSAGDFTVCVEAQDIEFTMSNMMTTECSGILYDSGGASGDYSPNEDYTFTICPGVVNQCIKFDLEYYNIEQSQILGSDQMVFYNGDNTNAPKILSLSGGDFGSVNGNGGVCKTIYAENCLTVQMITDETVQMEGFKASWQCSNRVCDLPVSIEVDTNATVEQLVEHLSSSLVDISITDIRCNRNAYGTFKASLETDLGIEKGILLTSGSADLARGPNEFEGDGLANLLPGDSDLDALSEILGSNLLSNDACIIEVEATVNTNELNFQFLFGSEEYPEFENSDFNDIFALFIEGPGIEGTPGLGNKKNLALIPETNTPIEINSVNSTSNWEYFRNNEKGLSAEYDGFVVDYRGSSKSLTASAKVIPCNTYKLKFAVADRVDYIFDSGVFISELTNNVPDLSLVSFTGFDYLLERCSDGQEQLVFQLNEAQEEDLKFAPVLSGTATVGEDYIIDLPDTIVIEAGQTLVTFPITVISDDSIEGSETIEITIQNDFGCDEVMIATLNIEIKEAAIVVAEGGLDSVYICAGSNYTLSSEGATSYSWTPTDVLVNSDTQTPTIENPQQSVVLTVTGSIPPFDDSSCTSSDMVTIIPVEPEISLETIDDLQLCLGDSITVQVNTNTEGVGISWENPDLGVLSPNATTTIIKPTASSLEAIPYVAVLTLDGCSVTDTLFIQVDEFNFPNVLVTDTLLCEGYQFQLAEEVVSEGTTYKWTPSDFLSSDSIANPVVTATEDITYKLLATSLTGACSDSVEINITVQENELSILESDSIFLCFPDSVMLSTQSTSQGQNITWEPSDIITPASGPNVLVKPSISGYALATMEFDGCVAKDSTWIQIDSLPSMDFEVIQEKDMYCVGEVITIVSEGYELVDFPNITFNWDPAPGIVSELDDRNLAIIAADTATFRRLAINGACRDTIEKEIFVLNPAVEIVVSDTSALCPFDPVGLSVVSEHTLEEIMWDPGTPDLTCDDCLNPIASVGQTTTFTVSVDADGCPATASGTVNIKNIVLVIGFNQNNVCPGTPVQLSLQGNGDITDINWGSANVLSCNDCPNPIATIDQTTQFFVTARVDGCEFTTSNTLTIDNSIRTAELIVTPNDTVPAGDEITLTVIDQATFGPNTTYEWFINGASQGLSDNPFITNQNDTIFTQYQVSIIDENGCAWSGNTQAIGAFPTFSLPNAFTPDGDGLNDVFRLIPGEKAELDNWEVSRFNIYNRWGQLVFECDSRECALITGWNGRLPNNNLAPAEVYIYAIQIEIASGQTLDFKGDVTLLR